MNAAAAPTIGPDAAGASQMAQNIARNNGYAMLPCGPDGQPLVPLRIASKLPLAISWARGICHALRDTKQSPKSPHWRGSAVRRCPV